MKIAKLMSICKDSGYCINVSVLNAYLNNDSRFYLKFPRYSVCTSKERNRDTGAGFNQLKLY